ncbi:FAD-dependent monooxygenase [Ningiella sp. W23]|uniref:FAD-dependent monooxygenase n=1 Tax=Ningiella sp. W23 TaxID=3023715 RepID=UPI00375698D1
MSDSFDVVIAGGGVVGCAAALALLKKTHLSVAVIESSPPKQSELHPSFDARVIALAKQSLEYLNDWQFDMSGVDAQKIKKIHVSDRHHLGQTVLDAHDLGIDCLGQVVRLEQLGFSLYQQINEIGKSAKGRLAYFTPEKIVQVKRLKTKVSLVTDKRKLDAKLLVIAEGAASNTRQLLGLEQICEDYEQSAIIANVHTQLPHEGVAYERFTKYGPIALLPMFDSGDSASKNDYASNKSQRLMSLVWTTKTEYAQRIQALTEGEFLSELSSLFGSRLGRFEQASQRFTYPLSLKRVPQFASHRCICIGNAAQNLHPIAGQGFNLGVRDIHQLALILFDESQFAASKDAGSFAISQAYKQMQSEDKQRTIKATDTLVRSFSNQYLPLVVGRNKALAILNTCSPLKARFARFAMGERA